MLARNSPTISCRAAFGRLAQTPRPAQLGQVRSHKYTSSSSLKGVRRVCTSSPLASTVSKSVPVLPRWMVEHRSVVRALPAIGNAAYASLACGFLCTDIFALRLLLVGGYSSLVTYHAFQQHPLRIPLKWSVFFVGINLAMVVQLAIDRLPVDLSEDEEALHVASFAPLSRKQFKKLLAIGERVDFAEGERITEERVV